MGTALLEEDCCWSSTVAHEDAARQRRKITIAVLMLDVIMEGLQVDLGYPFTSHQRYSFFLSHFHPN
jgi:hypothetical protein